LTEGGRQGRKEGEEARSEREVRERWRGRERERERERERKRWIPQRAREREREREKGERGSPSFDTMRTFVVGVPFIPPGGDVGVGE